MYDYLSTGRLLSNTRGRWSGDVPAGDGQEIAIVVSKAFQNQHIGRRCVLEDDKAESGERDGTGKANSYLSTRRASGCFVPLGSRNRYGMV